ncbi:MAG: thioredoxin family protein [Proteobacteria bacterium]|nr:thioredoxin family protein [Pseudomonadota bacterium]
MLSRRHLLAIAAFAGLVSSVPSHAAENIPYTPGAFGEAQKAGKPILVEIHADWCPTCRAQAPIISDLRKNPRFKDLVVFRVDFDGQKDVVKQLGARMQSTLIAFKGSREAGRSVGDTSGKTIEALLVKAL